MERVVHRDVTVRLAALAAVLPVVAVSAFEDVHLGVVDAGIHMAVVAAVPGAEMLGTAKQRNSVSKSLETAMTEVGLTK